MRTKTTVIKDVCDLCDTEITCKDYYVLPSGIFALPSGEQATLSVKVELNLAYVPNPCICEECVKKIFRKWLDK